MSKGSKPRPYSVCHKEFADNWDKVFTKKGESNSDRSSLNKEARR